MNKVCLNCKNQLDNSSEFCSKCNAIQPMQNMNHFERLHIQKCFKIDEVLLEQNYLKQQQIFHPDKQTNRSSLEKIIFLEYSMAINTAYKILKSPLLRAEYLLSLKGINVNSEISKIKPSLDLLEEIMSEQEKISEANDFKTLIALKESSINKFQCLIQNFAKDYESDLVTAAHTAIKLRYYDKLTQDIKLKINVISI